MNADVSLAFREPCEICGNIAGNRRHCAREMMFGTRRAFEYMECGNCGCLKLLDPPADMSEYYPEDYYAFQRHGWTMTQIRRRWAAYSCGENSIVGWIVAELYHSYNAMTAVHRLNLPKDARILELGAGSGRLLQDLAHFGYKRLRGVDPYISHDLTLSDNLTIEKKSFDEIEGCFDLVMLHHAFEHMSQPLKTIHSLAKLLSRNGILLLRMPVASSYGWRHYGINWVHLDPPRHMFLHTFKSVELLAAAAGLEVAGVIHEAEEISVTASEAYANDIPMNDPRYPLANIRKRLFGWFRRKRDKAQAEQLNKRGEADMICFYFRPIQ